MATERPPSIDPKAAARWQHLAMHASPWLHEEVGRRMEERLGWVKLQPAAWAHWFPVSGGLQTHGLIARRYPFSTPFVVEVPGNKQELAIKKIAKPWWSPIRWREQAARFEAPPEAGVQMLWANMVLHMAPDPQALMAAWHRALAVDGFLMFSGLGPDTLRELRGLYQVLGWPAPSHAFTDMHDWGDMLVAAGFAEPVMDMERITLSFATPERLLQELRSLGRNLHVDRFAGLRGRQWLGQLLAQLSTHLADEADGGQLKLTFEVIYGHALKPTPRVKVQAQTSLSLDEMRAVLRQGKGARNNG
jgi:malonyl-CoA O-methyltransferase